MRALAATPGPSVRPGLRTGASRAHRASGGVLRWCRTHHEPAADRELGRRGAADAAGGASALRRISARSLLALPLVAARCSAPALSRLSRRTARPESVGEQPACGRRPAGALARMLAEDALRASEISAAVLSSLTSLVAARPRGAPPRSTRVDALRPPAIDGREHRGPRRELLTSASRAENGDELARRAGGT